MLSMPRSCVMSALSISTTGALQLLRLVRRMLPLLFCSFDLVIQRSDDFDHGFALGFLSW